MFFDCYQKMKNCRGLTLMELIMVITIFALLAAVSLPIYSNWQTTSELDSAVWQLVETLRTAHTKSEAGFNNSAHGIYIDSEHNTFIYYQGQSYEQRNQEFDQVTSIDNNIAILINLGANEINFSKGTGLPSTTGTVDFVNTTGEMKSIAINKYSNIEVN